MYKSNYAIEEEAQSCETNYENDSDSDSSKESIKEIKDEKEI